MAAGSDARVGIALETTYATRVAPARFIPLTSETLGFEKQRYFSPAIGTGRWSRPSITTTRGGTGSIGGDVPTVGFSYLVNGLHNNTVTPTAQGGSPIAYLHTHTLDTPTARSYSIQVQTPPVTSSTLLPHDLLGVVFGGITFSWSAGGVLSYEMPAAVNNLSLTESLATFTPPAAYALLPFSGGTVTIGGSLEGNIIGDGSVALNFSQRTDAFYLGTGGTMAKPVENDKPTAEGNFTADFVDNANINRMLNDTVADVVVKFENPTAISGANKPYVQITLQDCVFQTPRPTVSGPGLLEQPVTFTAASSTGDPPIIAIMTSEATI